MKYPLNITLPVAYDAGNIIPSVQRNAEAGRPAVNIMVKKKGVTNLLEHAFFFLSTPKAKLQIIRIARIKSADLR